MLLDNKEAFKKWLIETLNPICEAEPDTLASYVVALVKKDRSEADLVEICCRELEVFLLDETKRFVKKLFETLRTKSYLPKNEPIEKAKEKLKQPVQLTQYKGLPKRDQEKIEDGRGLVSHDKREVHSRMSRRRSSEHRTRSRGSSRRALEASYSRNKSPPIRLGKRSVKDDMAGDDDDGDDDVISMASSRKRNRSDSSGHSVVSRTRYWRSRPQSKTPPSTTNNSNNNNNKQKCHNYMMGYCKLGDACAYQHADTQLPIEGSKFTSQSFGTLPAYMPQSGLPNITKPPPALPYNNQFSIPTNINPLPPSFKLPPPQAAQPVQYLQNPYQMPIQQTPVQDTFNQYHPEPYVPMPARFNQPPPLLTTSSTNNYLPTDHNQHQQQQQQQLQLHETSNADDIPYNPQNTNLYLDNDNDNSNNNNNSNQYIDNMGGGDDDDDVSVTSRQSVKRTASEVGLNTQHPSFADKQVKRSHAFENKNVAMAGKKKNPGSYQYVQNTVLELRRIPAEDNTITNINSHFSKFGIIVNLQINFDNDPCAALVAFASAAQASAAHKSKEPFLNNRFIRIFWHNPEKREANSNAAAGAGGSVQDKQALQKMKTHVSIPERHLLTLDNTKKKSTGMTEEGVEGDAAVPALVVPPRSALKLQRNITKEPNRACPRDLKSKRSDLDKLLQYSKLLTTLFENASDNEEKKQLSMKMESNMRSMKSLQEDIKVLASKKAPYPTPACHFRLNRRLSSGKMAEVEAVPGDDQVKTAGECSRNPFKKVNKAATTTTTVPSSQPTKALLKVDRRPRELLVTGFPANENKLSVLSHMKNYGEIEKSGYIEQPASLLVTYKHRSGAEKAMSLGSNYKESSLKIIWWDNLINKNNKNNNKSTNNNNNNKINNNDKNREENKPDVEGDIDKENSSNNSTAAADDDDSKSDGARLMHGSNEKDVESSNNINNNKNGDDNDAASDLIVATPNATAAYPGGHAGADSSISKNAGDDNDKGGDIKAGKVDGDDKKGGGADDDANKKGNESWLASYFDDFNQHLDYEEDEAMDEGLLDEEEEEEDGGRSWRR